MSQRGSGPKELSVSSWLWMKGKTEGGKSGTWAKASRTAELRGLREEVVSPGDGARPSET